MLKTIVIKGSYGRFQSPIEKSAADFEANSIAPRIFKKDFTIWNSDPSEISNRLGWLDCPDVMQMQIADLETFAREVTEAGYEKAILLGMGGSSLAPEVFRKVLGARSGYLDLTVVDSTHPDYIKGVASSIDPAKTLFIVSTKSGGTVETLSFFKYFYRLTVGKLGPEKAGGHFIAITDSGSKLEKLAKEYKFRRTFLNDPNIGGRYAALSHFGLVPAALVGVELSRIIDSASKMKSRCAAIDENPGGALGVTMGELANQGYDKVTLILPDKIEPFGAWVEQLIAESTGKDGKGILPVYGEELLDPQYYSKDRYFVQIRMGESDPNDIAIDNLVEAGFPVTRINIGDIYDLGGLYFLWEFATAIAGWRIGIQPFDQPNVESAKVLAREMVSVYQREGKLPSEPPAFTEGSIDVFSREKFKNVGTAITGFLDEAKNIDGAYVCIQAYLAPSITIDERLGNLRSEIQKKYKVATTVGYGPRFLHSTGQLHKGDGGKGLFLVLTDSISTTIPIPDEPSTDSSGIDFGTLITAQSSGDRQALLDAGRNVIRFHFKSNTIAGIGSLIDGLAG